MSKKLLLMFTVLAIGFTCVAQDYTDPQNMDVDYNRDAEYPGGVNNFIVDLWNQMEYTQDAIDALIDGEIMVSFDIEPDSTVSGVSIISGLGHGVDEEFTRILSTMKFSPALVEGSPVKMNMMLNVPIRVGPKSRLKSVNSFADGLKLVGNVGGYDIEIFIDSSNYETGEFSGKYRYLSQENYLEIKGVNYGSALYIEEFYNDKQTGTFILTVSEDGFAGWWTNDEKAFEVVLTIGDGDVSLLSRKSDEEYSAECNSDISGTYEVNYYFINDYFATEDNPYYELGYNGGTAIFELLDDDRLKFEIDMLCGPTFHTAYAEGVAFKVGDTYVYENNDWDEERPCNIVFKFSEKGVHAQSSSRLECGFGARAYIYHDLIKVQDWVEE